MKPKLLIIPVLLILSLLITSMLIAMDCSWFTIIVAQLVVGGLTGYVTGRCGLEV